MTLQLWQFFEFPVRAEVAAAYAIPLIIITLALFWRAAPILGRKGYVALTGKGGSRTLTPLGPLALGRCSATALFVVALAVILPYAALAQAAFSKAWGLGFSFANLTLDNFYQPARRGRDARQTIVHSFTYSAAAGCVAVALALLVGLCRQPQADAAAAACSTMLCMAPLVIPGIVLGDRLLRGLRVSAGRALRHGGDPDPRLHARASCRSPTSTAWRACARSIPKWRKRSASSAAAGCARSPAWSCRCSRRACVGTWLLVFIPATRELSTAIFLVAAQTRVISVMMLDLSENGSFETLAALGFFLLGATILIVLLGYKIVGRDFMLRRS